MYLFDTDTITNLLKRAPSQQLLKKLSGLAPERQHISTITVYEIVYGAHKSERKQHHLRNLQEVLLPSVRLVGFDAAAAFVCGALRAELEATGLPLPLADLQVASIAIANELVLITGNVRHFARVKRLKVDNWM